MLQVRGFNQVETEVADMSRTETDGGSQKRRATIRTVAVPLVVRLQVQHSVLPTALPVQLPAHFSG
jgi:hypothetical protein